MTTANLFPVNDEDDDNDSTPIIEDPTNIRPDLGALGILEHSRGICEDTYENRSILRSSTDGLGYCLRNQRRADRFDPGTVERTWSPNAGSFP
jgi:hypothetical protein